MVTDELHGTWSGREIEVDLLESMGEVTAQELRVLGIPVPLTEELSWRLCELSAELEEWG